MTENNKSEELFLQDYDASLFVRPNTSIDTVIFTIQEAQLQVLLIRRAEHPFQDYWSLVGGYVDVHKDDSIEATAKRKLTEKTGVKTPYLEQFETIGNATRDPRGWSITTVYFALISAESIDLKAGNGASDIKWSKIKEGRVEEKLAFDHELILRQCVERLKNKVLYTSLPVHFMPGEFTLGELQKIYEIILDKKIDHKSFRRRMLSADIIEENGRVRRESKKPAKLYHLKENHKTHFFLRNIEG
jgi:ADP-ribose pyrophosphatase YjhB (NUDIX family)